LNKLKIITSFFYLCILCFKTYATGFDLPILEENILNSQANNTSFFLSKEPLNQLSIDSFPFQKFKNNKHKIINQYISNDEYCWILLETPTSINPGEKKYLLIDNPLTDSIILYELHNNFFIPKSYYSIHNNYSNRKTTPNLIEFQLKPGKIYLLKTKNTPNIYLPIYYYNNNQYAEINIENAYYDGVYIGFMIIMFLYIFIFYLRSFEKIYLFYSLFLLGVFSTLLLLHGHAFKYIYPTMPFFNAHINGNMSLLLIFTPIFVSIFLDIKIIKKNHLKFYYSLSILYFLNGICSYLISDYFAKNGLQILATTQMVLFISDAILSYKLKQENVIFFIIGWGIYLLGAMNVVFVNLNLIPAQEWSLKSIAYGSIFETIVFTTAIANKYSKYKKDNESFQDQLIESLKEKEKLLNEQNSLLEIEVRKRTTELEKSNLTLNDLNKNLNNIIESKTEDLRKTIEELSLFNKQLQQFSFITSHNLRSPVTTLKGLFNLIELSQNNEEKNDLVNKANTMINKLDEILIDLNDILNQQKITGEDNIEEIDLLKIINEVSVLLSEGLQHNISLSINHNHALLGFKSYFTSIFYNLISNSIKYKQKNLDISISIKTYEIDNKIVIEYKDNGIGIDLEKYGANVFGMYKRFNMELPGKGLGLYITKTQIELMKGSIEIRSAVNQGTTMIIQFPILRRS
jgi:signal transduction histidine kinase